MHDDETSKAVPSMVIAAREDLEIARQVREHVTSGQGVLVLGPNRLFLGYIEQVLPSLGEAGIQIATLGDLVETLVAARRAGGSTQ